MNNLHLHDREKIIKEYGYVLFGEVYLLTHKESTTGSKLGIAEVNMEWLYYNVLRREYE